MAFNMAHRPIEHPRHPLVFFLTSLRAAFISRLWRRGLRKRTTWSHGSAFRFTAYDW